MPRGSSASAIIRPLGPLASSIASMFQPPRNTIRGVETTDWFGPLQPVAPIAPSGTEPRGFQYNAGQNLNYTPRADSVYSAQDLRNLAAYPLAQMCIQNVCDMICRMPITVRLKRDPEESGAEHKKRQAKDDLLPRLQELVDQPNPEQTRQDFIRDILQDMLVGDWASILIRRKGKQVQELRAIDGSTITRYINEQGYTPTPEEGPAYAQLWYGIPMVDLTTDQLIYAMRNRKRNGLYGYSPTEQGAEELKIGIERLNFVLQFYTAGSIPDMFQVVPMGIDPDKIKESQDWLDSTLAGQLARRRGLRLVQGFTNDGKDQFVNPKDKALSDDFDDRHIRKIAFLYGTSPQRLLKTLNRASAGANQEAAEEEGTMPWVDWLIERVYNWLFQRVMRLPQYEATIDTDVEIDMLKEAQADEIDVAKTPMITINEARARRGLDPRPEKEANELGIATMNGWVPLDADAAAERAGTMSEAVIQPAADGDQNEPGNKKPKPGDKKPKPKPKKKARIYVY
jgi:phage portal protein BeeE